jgi:putative membrane protein insertion efficiency factor
MGQFNDGLKHLMCVPIRLYQYTLSPMFPSSCRFYPSCSEYALHAIKKHGSIRGLVFTCLRLCRCHPYSKGGYDPVPDFIREKQ